MCLTTPQKCRLVVRLVLPSKITNRILLATADAELYDNLGQGHILPIFSHYICRKFRVVRSFNLLNV